MQRVAKEKRVPHQASKSAPTVHPYWWSLRHTHFTYASRTACPLRNSHHTSPIHAVTPWSQAFSTTIKPIVSVYKQAIKIMDWKPVKCHHCHILTIDFNSLRLFCKCLNIHLMKMFSEVAIRSQSSHIAVTHKTSPVVIVYSQDVRLLQSTELNLEL